MSDPPNASDEQSSEKETAIPTLEERQLYFSTARTLRYWLLAYGIGVPAILFTNETFWGVLSRSSLTKYIIWLFLAGITIQVSLQMGLKEWCYLQVFGPVKKGKGGPPRDRTSRFCTSLFWGSRLDRLTFAIFLLGTLLAFYILLGPAHPPPPLPATLPAGGG